MSLLPQEEMEILELASAAMDGRLDGSGLKRLERFLGASEEARQLYVRFMTVSSGLVTTAQDAGRVAAVDAQMKAAAVVAPVAQGRGRSIKVWRWAAMAAAACLLLVGLLLVTRPWDEPVKMGRAQVAVLGDTLDPVWEEGAYLPGERLNPGVINLKSGFARINFVNGTTVGLEGPAEFEVVSAHEGYCRRGKLVARIPAEAREFSLRSPTVSVVNATGWYGIELTPTATGIPEAVVHVFQGEATVEREGLTAISLAQGEALSVTGDLVARQDADQSAFSEWDFNLPRPGGAGGGGRHEGRPSLTETILLSIHADDLRRPMLQPSVERLSEAYRAYAWGGDPWSADSISHAFNELWPLFSDPEASDETLTAALQTLREARANAKANLRSAQESLRGRLTLREEAILVGAGWIE